MSDEQVPIGKIVRAYVNIRNRRAELKREFEGEDTVLKEAQEALSNTLLQQMQATGVESLRTKHGTVYQTTKVIPTAADWDMIYKWIAENDGFDMLEKRLKSTFVSAYMEQNDGEAPPGVSVIRRLEANIRKAS